MYILHAPIPFYDSLWPSVLSGHCLCESHAYPVGFWLQCSASRERKTGREVGRNGQAAGTKPHLWSLMTIKNDEEFYASKLISKNKQLAFVSNKVLAA